MAAYDLWLLVMLAPALFWLVVMFRAVKDVHERAVEVTEWDSSVDEELSYG